MESWKSHQAKHFRHGRLAAAIGPFQAVLWAADRCLVHIEDPEIPVALTQFDPQSPGKKERCGLSMAMVL